MFPKISNNGNLFFVWPVEGGKVLEQWERGRVGRWDCGRMTGGRSRRKWWKWWKGGAHLQKGSTHIVFYIESVRQSLYQIDCLLYISWLLMHSNVLFAGRTPDQIISDSRLSHTHDGWKIDSSVQSNLIAVFLFQVFALLKLPSRWCLQVRAIFQQLQFQRTCIYHDFLVCGEWDFWRRQNSKEQLYNLLQLTSK